MYYNFDTDMSVKMYYNFSYRYELIVRLQETGMLIVAMVNGLGLNNLRLRKNIGIDVNSCRLK